jgi:hypothetical protein
MAPKKPTHQGRKSCTNPDASQTVLPVCNIARPRIVATSKLPLAAWRLFVAAKPQAALCVNG